VTLVLCALLAPVALLLAVEVGVRVVARRPCRVGFYGSVARDRVRALQDEVGVRANRGPGWVHLGWIADPARERYTIERWIEGSWHAVGEARFGSSLLREGGRLRVRAVGRGEPRTLGEVAVEIDREAGPAPVLAPRVAGPWRFLFRPSRHGNYVNDHCIFRDARGDWRLVGITGPGDGDYTQERHFALGVSASFPPAEGMREEAPLASFGELAWAPCALRAGPDWWLFWSPHVLHRMRSRDGIAWTDHEVVLRAAQHPFFRDASIVEVAPGQWLLYATARGRWFSRVDVYQSFDLRHWQYIRPALRTGWGSERNSAFASTESPTVVCRGGRWYLALTYTNETGGWAAVRVALRLASRRASYDETLVFHADAPYDFGCYRGRRDAPTLVARLEAHAPELVEHPDTGEWWITTAGWPWAATLTRGEVAVAPLAWEAAGVPTRAGDRRRPRAGSREVAEVDPCASPPW
jgi:hypothetical protein